MEEVEWSLLGKLKEIYGSYSNAISVLLVNYNNNIPLFHDNLNISLKSKSLDLENKDKNEQPK